jgi:hypothetical protein
MSFSKILFCQMTFSIRAFSKNDAQHNIYPKCNQYKDIKHNKTQHNYTQNYDIQHNDFHHKDTQHKTFSSMTVT